MADAATAGAPEAAAVSQPDSAALAALRTAAADAMADTARRLDALIASLAEIAFPEPDDRLVCAKLRIGSSEVVLQVRSCDGDVREFVGYSHQLSSVEMSLAREEGRRGAE